MTTLTNDQNDHFGNLTSIEKNKRTILPYAEKSVSLQMESKLIQPMFRLKEVLKEKRITSAQFAVIAGIGTTALSHYLTGKSSPTLAQVEHFADLLEVDIMQLIRKPNPDGSYPPAPRKTKAEKQALTRAILLTYCQYYHNEPTLPPRLKDDMYRGFFWNYEWQVCTQHDMYLYQGDELRRQFYMRMTQFFVGLSNGGYQRNMDLYFHDLPKVKEEMYAIFGHPDELPARFGGNPDNN